MARCLAFVALLLLLLPRLALAESAPGVQASKQSFGSRCESDGQCLEGVCRNVSPELRICTLLCAQSSECPETVPCEKGLCAASEAILRSQSCAGSSCLAGEETIEGGCAVGGPPGGAGWLALLGPGCLLITRWWRGRPRRFNHAVARRARRV